MIAGFGDFSVDCMGGDVIREVVRESFVGNEVFVFELTSDSGMEDCSAALGTVERRAENGRRKVGGRTPRVSRRERRKD